MNLNTLLIYNESYHHFYLQHPTHPDFVETVVGDSLKQDLSFLVWDQNLAVRADSPTRPEGPTFRSWAPVLVLFGKKKKKGI